MKRSRLLRSLILVLALTGCGSDESSGPQLAAPASAEPTVRVDIDARRPALMLSEYRLFSDLRGQTPSEGVLPYSLNSTHFADYAETHHYIFLPPGTRATYHESDVFAFPLGTVLVQTLAFLVDRRDPDKGERPVETRLLIHQRKGWVAVPYLWNAEGTDARRAVIGGKTDVRWIHEDGSERSHQLITPDMNQCKRCHKQRDRVRPIGLHARNLHRRLLDRADDQLALWVEYGLLTGTPDALDETPKAVVWNDPTTGSIEDRARTWLDINCAHCHNPEGAASVSGLDLSVEQTMPVKFGVYKPPVAAGRGSSGYKFSIEPGSPETSFLLHRIRSTDPGVMMPTVGRSLVDSEGAALIEEWIRDMPADEQLAERARDPVDAYRDALRGGDAARGRELFYSTAKCSACHRADRPDGGDVGPSLSDVGSRAQPDHLLESIVSPSAKIAEKHETVVVQLVDGQFHTGVVRFEDKTTLVLKKADASSIELQKSRVAVRTLSRTSTMPSMANILSTREVADLIEFLSSLKVRATKRSSAGD